MTYVIYIISAVALINIWAYSYVGVWLAGTLGTGIAISLTFVLGLFTSSVLGNVLALRQPQPFQGVDECRRDAGRYPDCGTDAR